MKLSIVTANVSGNTIFFVAAIDDLCVVRENLRKTRCWALIRERDELMFTFAPV
jgi:hypothetical protein